MNKYDRQAKVIKQEDAEMLKILAHPVRLQIILELMNHTKTNVKSLVEKLDIPQSTVSQHLAKLRGCILGCERHGLEVFYYLKNEKARSVINALNKN